MNAQQAKQLSLPDLLAKLGHQPTKTLKGGSELWYKSPFRHEQEPSFHTSFLGGKWIWNDFGDSGGTVVDFAMRYYTTDFAGALAKLQRLTETNSPQLRLEAGVPTTQVPAIPANDPKTLCLRTVKALSIDSVTGKTLLQYLTQQRGIDPLLATKYLLEVHFLNQETGKTYFAAGISNEVQGYEIRNAYFKSSIGKKGVTLIKGKKQGQAAVFEGFMDFLSALTYYQAFDLTKFQEVVQGDTLIMHSASFHQRTNELLQAGNYTTIHLYLDNDPTGQRTRERLQAQFPGLAVDGSAIYKGYKDFNLFLRAYQATQVKAR